MREKYETLPLATLKELAKARGIKGISTMKKADVIEAMLQEDEKEKAKEKEGEGILKSLKEEAFIITLEIQGEMLDSVELAEKMQSLFVNGYSHIQFVIGGSLGLSKSVIKKGNLHLSFSKMTFPHPLMRVILLEQIYRANRIQRGEPYHK